MDHLRLHSGPREVDLIVERADRRVLGVKLGSAVGDDNVAQLLWQRDQIGDMLIESGGDHDRSLRIPPEGRHRVHSRGASWATGSSVGYPVGEQSLPFTWSMPESSHLDIEFDSQDTTTLVVVVSPDLPIIIEEQGNLVYAAIRRRIDWRLVASCPAATAPSPAAAVPQGSRWAVPGTRLPNPFLPCANSRAPTNDTPRPSCGPGRRC